METSSLLFVSKIPKTTPYTFNNLQISISDFIISISSGEYTKLPLLGLIVTAKFKLGKSFLIYLIVPYDGVVPPFMFKYYKIYLIGILFKCLILDFR